MSDLDILDVPVHSEDVPDAKTIGDYFATLLVVLLEDKEGFSGKRPFGNSDWIWDLYVALGANNNPATGKPWIEATFDGPPSEGGDIADLSDEQRDLADALLIQAVVAAFKAGPRS